MLFLLTLACLGGTIYYVIRANVAYGFHYRGKGEMLARAAYAHALRETPNAPDARLSEPEFVAQFIGKGPRVGRSIFFALGCGVLFVVIGIIAVFAGIAHA